MERRTFITGALSMALSLQAGRLWSADATNGATSSASFPPVSHTEKEWRSLLDPDQYDVLFEEATERPWSSPLNKEKRAGTYVCAACFLPLFSSETKYDSGTGWPSFYASIEGHTGTSSDWKLLIPRTEYHCIRCGGHQGHVFNDGPEPTGKRWCNNGVALRFIPQSDELPKLRG